MRRFVDQLKYARYVFVCGNGGSATTAEHFTVDLFSKGIKAICLNSNTAVMTKIANDHGYDFTFSDQLALYATQEDLLVTISCSGTSPNIVNALNMASYIGMSVYSFETFKKKRDYEKLEDEHLQFVHKIKKMI